MYLLPSIVNSAIEGRSRTTKPASAKGSVSASAEAGSVHASVVAASAANAGRCLWASRTRVFHAKANGGVGRSESIIQSEQQALR